MVDHERAGEVPRECEYGYGVLDHGDCTNNDAEYEALRRAAMHAVAHGWPPGCKFEFLGDSRLVVEQVNGTFKVRSPRLKIAHRKVRRVLDALNDTWQLRWVPRKDNARADQLSKLGKMRSSC